MAHLANLNSAQLAAVVAEADVVQVLAPPGSGKTKTLTSRVAHLLGDRGFLPWNVICLTFTIKSAREMKERVAKLIGDDVGSKVILGTFHSVCRRYLSYYGHLIGIKKGFGIADTSDTMGIITRIIKRGQFTIEPKQARSKISSCKAKNIGWEQLQREHTSKNKGADQHEFVSIYQQYEDYLATSNLLDYDDLLLRCLRLLHDHPECANNVQAVLIDEFQDTNSVQFDLMNLFARRCKTITTVGDPDQSIYGWRNAEITNLTKMQTLWPETLVINLEYNYRSAGRILKIAQRLIEQDTSRPEKQLVAVHRNGKAPVFRLLPNAATEAEWIVSEIKRLSILSAGLLICSDFSILLRTAALSRQIEASLGKHGIPYRMVGGVKFFDRAEVKILLDYLRVIAQPANSDALARIINVPPRHIGDVTVKALLEEAIQGKTTMWHLVSKAAKGYKVRTKLSSSQMTGIGSLVNVILTCQKKLADQECFTSPRTLLQQTVKMLRFSEYLEHKYKEDHEIRWENVQELFAQADDVSYNVEASEITEEALPALEDVEQQAPSGAAETLVRFLANVALSTEKQTEDETDAEGRVNNKVTISTIHAAKGLEWPIIFIPACYQGNIPHSRNEDGDEERRLLYVAMTRAKALLYLSRPMRSSMGEETTVSVYIDDPNIGDRLAIQGHMLGYHVFEDIASILSRKCPDPSNLAKAIRASNLESLLDDRWPLDGQPAPTDNKVLWSGLQDDHGYVTAKHSTKRRKVSEQEAANAAYSEVRSLLYSGTAKGDPSHSTMPPQTAGFMSAAQQMQIQASVKPEKDATSRSEESGPSKDTTGKTSKTSKSKATKRETGQSSLASWFAGEKPAIKEMVEGPKSLPLAQSQFKWPPQAVPSPRPVASSRETSTELASRQPMASAPTCTVNRTIRPPFSFAPLRKPVVEIIDHGRTPQQKYVLLSSSPPPDDPPADTGSDRGEISRDTQGGVVAPSTRIAASTTHITTMDRLAGRVQAPGPRRLGTRGPMMPWSARGGRSGLKSGKFGARHNP